MEEKDNIDYKSLYFYLFNRISWLMDRIARDADESDEKTKAFLLQLHLLHLMAEEKYLSLAEDAENHI